MLRWLHGDDCGVALDTRHEPIVITTWCGSSTCALIDDYFRWSDANTAAAMATEQRLIHVVDLRHSGRPSALVRKRAMEHAREDLAAEVRLSTIVVAEPTMGAVARIAGREGRYWHAPSIVETIEEAIELALLELRDARIPAPVGLTPRHYRAPTLVSAG
jgi:multidrug resistance efflux pump